MGGDSREAKTDNSIECIMSVSNSQYIIMEDLSANCYECAVVF